jgi:cobalt-zinc-cadmium efflux system outer membrane protein
MHWKRVVFVWVAALCVARAQTVEALVRKAIDNNRELLAMRQRVAEARGLLRQAGVRPAPAVEIDGSTGRPLGTRGEEEYSAGYSYPFETFGKRDKRVRVAGKAVELAEAELVERTRQLVFEVKARYAEALAEQQKLAALDRLLAANRDSYRLTEARVQQGDAAPLERQLLLVELNRAEAQRAAAAGRVEAALIDLRRLAGLTPSDSLTLGEGPDKLKLIPLTQLKQRALESRADLRVARLLEEQGAAEVDLAEAQSRPDVALSARYSRRSAQFEQFGLTASGLPVPLRDRDNILSLGVSVPLLTRKRNLGAIEAAGARAAGARLRREHLGAAIPLEVEASWQRWEAARRALEILEGGVVRQSEQNLEIMRQAYGLGQLRMLDVLNEQRRLIDTQMAHIEAKAELARALAELERAAGGEVR